MDPERLQQVQEVFDAASELPADKRRRFLDERCAADPDLRRDVAALLASSDASGPFDELAADVAASGTGPVGPDTPPSQVGAYRIVDRLGHGGMGAVYLAERADGQFEQRGALKLLRDDLPGEEARRRFLAERQILARVSHPNIAGLLDGGVTDKGQPYFVMEHVDGVPIDVYCDRERLSVDERLDLFREVCSAVHYAHRHLIVHRDLKPANILVKPDGTVKLLDFGIAKLLDPEQIPASRPDTLTGVRMMTPEYASPEQVRGETVTTASDIYQLGVLLFELLTGRRPYRLKGRSLLDVERLITATDPDRPSTAVSRVEEIAGAETTPRITPEQISRSRNTTVEKLRRRLAGDLDNIVLMALRKEPERRYGSAEQLGEDVRRHQKGLPVRARPDTVGYRTAKFVRRHTIGVATTAVGILAVVGFAVAMGIQAGRTERERYKAEQIAAFLVAMFEQAEPGVALGDTVTVREVLDWGAARVRMEPPEHPEVQAGLMSLIGSVYARLGLPDEAERLWASALDIRQGVLRADDPEIGGTLSDLGSLWLQTGKHDQAERVLRRAAAILRTAGRREWRRLGVSLQNLGLVLQVKGEYDEAVATYEEALEVKRRASEEVHTIMINLGWLKMRRGDLDEAETLFRDALAIRRELFSAGHPKIASALSSLAWLLERKGEYTVAERAAREALAIRQKLYPDAHPDLADSYLTLGNILAGQGLHQAADSLLQAALTTYIEVYGESVLPVATVKRDRARHLLQWGHLEDSERLAREALALYQQLVGDDHPNTVLTKETLARTLHARSNTDEAERLWREAVETVRGSWIDERVAGRVMIDLASLLMERADNAEAESLIREALALLRKRLPDTRLRMAEAQSALGICLARQGRFEEAEPLVLEGYTALRDAPGAAGDSVQTALDKVVELYETWGRYDEADRYRRR